MIHKLIAHPLSNEIVLYISWRGSLLRTLLVTQIRDLLIRSLPICASAISHILFNFLRVLICTRCAHNVPFKSQKKVCTET